MTAVAVVAIAAIGVVFTTLVWPQIRQNILRSTFCSQAFNCNCPGGGGMCECSYCANAGTDGSAIGQDNANCDEQPINCPDNSAQ